MPDLIFQEPPHLAGQPAGLFLLFHGVGSNPQDLRSLGEDLAARHAQAWVVGVQSPDPSDLGQGWQWFPVRAITAENRPHRVAAAMPRFVQAVQAWQRRSGATVQHTTLLGFSQGAIMALESTQQAQRLAARVLSLAGRFALPPQRVPEGTRIHLLHGQADGVVPAQASVEAFDQLQALQANVSLDLIPGLAHGIDRRMTALLHARLAEAG